MDLKAVAAVGLSVDHVHQVVVLLLRLSVAARPVVPRPAALLIAHKRGRVVDEARRVEACHPSIMCIQHLLYSVFDTLADG